MRSSSSSPSRFSSWRGAVWCAVALVVVAAALAPSRAHADPTGPEILERVDKALNAFSDGVFESKMLIKEPNGQSREFGFTTFQKVPDKRLVRFTSPGDVKGMGILVADRETLYVFLPGFQRIRRMGTHVKNQTFMGSDFSFEDMAGLSLAPAYDAKLAGSEANNYVLELNARPGKDPEFARIKLWVDKTTYVCMRFEYFDSSGRKLKTQWRSDYKKFTENYSGPGRVIVTDHRRNDHTSEILFLNTKINTGLADDLFSQRSLIRGQ